MIPFLYDSITYGLPSPNTVSVIIEVPAKLNNFTHHRLNEERMHVAEVDRGRRPLPTEDDRSIGPHQWPGGREGTLDRTEQGVQGTDRKVRRVFDTLL